MNIRHIFKTEGQSLCNGRGTETNAVDTCLACVAEFRRRAWEGDRRTPRKDPIEPQARYFRGGA